MIMRKTATIPPKKLDARLNAKARAVSPLFDMGYASNVVAMDEGVPGILIKPAETKPPDMAPTNILESNINAVSGLKL